MNILKAFVFLVIILSSQQLLGTNISCDIINTELKHIYKDDQLKINPTIEKASSILDIARANNCNCLPDALNLLAYKYHYISNFYMSKKLLLESEQLISDNGDLGMPYINNLLFSAFNHIAIDDNKEAINLLKKAMKQAKILGDNKVILYVNTKLALCYRNEKNYDLAIKTHTEIIENPDKYKQYDGYGYAVENMSVIHYDLKEYSIAFDYSNKALDYWLENDHTRGLYFCYYHRAELFEIQGEHRKRLTALQKAKALGVEHGYSTVDIYIDNYIGECYEALNIQDSLIMTYEAILDKYQTIHAHNLKMIATTLSNHYLETKNFDKNNHLIQQMIDNALEYTNKTNQNVKEIQERNLKIDDQLVEFSELNKESIIKQRRLTSQYWISGILLLGLAFGTLFFRQISKADKFKKLTIKKIVSKNAELKELNDSLDLKNRELERFAYVTSHDIKSPLNTISQFTQLTIKKLKNDRQADVSEYLEFISGSSKNLINLTDELLSYAKSTQMVVKRTEINSSLLIKSILEDLSETIETENAEVTYLNNNLNVISDELKLRQILQNLIANAIKFHKTGEKSKVHIVAKEKNNAYEFSIQDNGVGIDKKYHKKIFNMFDKLGHPRSGTGIGLATVSKLVETLEGRIKIDSVLEKGSTFTCIFPKLPVTH